MITADALVCHAVGDYVLQSHWMAGQKTGRWLPAVLHALTYVLPFILLTRSPVALVVIAATHLLIDRYRLARYVTAFKNIVFSPDLRDLIGNPEKHGRKPTVYNPATGYPVDAPPWLSTWLLIIADNLMHVIINGLALTYLSYSLALRHIG